MFTVVTGRFNSETLFSNYEYRRKYNFTCMYCCPSKLSPKILHDTLVFVIEMNNSTKMIDGIGLLKNILETDKYYSSILNEKHYIYSFLTSYAARNCYSLLNKYKEVNKKYPENELNNKLTTSKDQLQNVTSTSSGIYIEDESFEKLKRQCGLNGISLLGITKFEYTYEDSVYLKKNIFDITMEASEIISEDISYAD